ncbi:MAG: hypothetical protein ACOC11_00135 [Prolixibacteraceae bacterium]
MQRHPFVAADPVLLAGGCDWNEHANSLTKQVKRNKMQSGKPGSQPLNYSE